MLQEIPFERSAFELADDIKNRRFTIPELLEAHLSRLPQIQERTNAIIHFRDPALLRKEAVEKQTELERATDPRALPPLWGVPFSVKGSWALQGEPWSAGCYARKDLIAEEDSELIRKLKTAGAIPIVLTNLPEASIWIETFNHIQGRTMHPLSRRRTPGGSSGGEAALIASGGSPFGIGTDFAGSIRIPAFFCGISGHKPSPGLLPSQGQWPAPTGRIERISCSGFMSRHARDLRPLHETVLGYSFPRTEIRNLRFFYSASHLAEPIYASARKLLELGASVQEWKPKWLARAGEIWMATVTQAREHKFIEILSAGEGLGEIHFEKELLKWLFSRKSKRTFSALAMLGIEKYLPEPKFLAKKFLKAGDDLKKEFQDQLGNDGVFISPPYSRVAPFHHEPKLRLKDIFLSGIFNALEMPSTAVPVGCDSGGWPLGVLCSSLSGQDELCFTAAESVENRQGMERMFS